MCFFCFCRQKTAYEIRISDWSSDVCSSDLRSGRLGAHDDVFDEGAAAIVFHDVVLIDGLVVLDLIERGFVLDLPTASFLLPVDRQIIEAGDQQRIFGEEGNDDRALTRQLPGQCEDAMSSLAFCRSEERRVGKGWGRTV